MRAVALRIEEIAQGAYRTKSRSEIRGRCYVVASLEAALWCFARTSSLREAVLAAANLGEDADTTAAVCGQVAGAYYGIGAIPAEWLGKLAMWAEIPDLARRLFARQTT